MICKPGVIEACADFWVRQAFGAWFFQSEKTGRQTEATAMEDTLDALLQASARRDLPPDAPEKFKRLLVAALTRELEGVSERQGAYGWCVRTDYQPAPGALKEACDAMGPRFERLLPSKTRSWIYPDRVTVARGYGAQTEAWFPASVGT